MKGLLVILFILTTGNCFADDQRLNDLACFIGSDLASVQWNDKSLRSDPDAQYLAYWACHHATFYNFDHSVDLTRADQIKASATMGVLLQSKVLKHPEALTDSALLLTIQSLTVNQYKNGGYDDVVEEVKKLEKSGKYPKFKPALSY